MTEASLADRIDALLPQTQCTRCGYPGCKPYAQAIAEGCADINQCPPGGAAGIVKLADLLKTLPKPLNPANGVEKPLEMAVIDESLCIGCTLCIQACPVDAIVGAAKLMHTVLRDWCTGCELCIAPCPVDLHRHGQGPSRASLDPARRRPGAHPLRRPQRAPGRRGARTRTKTRGPHRACRRGAAGPAGRRRRGAKKAIIAAAVERARAQRAAVAPQNVDAVSDEVKRQIEQADARRARLAKKAPS